MVDGMVRGTKLNGRTMGVKLSVNLHIPQFRWLIIHTGMVAFQQAAKAKNKGFGVRQKS